jgi:hypothetical protein
MLWYAPHRQIFPLIAARTSSSEGPIGSFINAAPDMICPGVQYPH